MNRFQRSWQLFKSSLNVMQQNKKLLVFPIVISVLTLGIVMFFFGAFAFQPTGYSYASAAHWKTVANSIWVSTPAAAGSDRAQGALRPLAVVYLAIIYFVCMFLATFCNVAFYSEILKALNGQTVSIRAGFQFALTRWKSILLWSAFAGLIGYIIKTIEERSGIVGKIVLRLVGTAWSVACVFVIPVIIMDSEANPFVVLKKSAQTLKNTWGESLIGYAGLAFGSTIVLIGSVVYLGGAFAVAVALHNFWLFGIAGFAWLIGICAFSYLTSVASQIYRCALYLYATTGSVPAPYDVDMMSMAWKMKKS
jgi:hypothetical protein